jgi:hypothetical protein
VFTPEATYCATQKQDRGIAALHCASAHHVLLSSSWDNALRVFDARAPGKAVCVPNESGSLFVGMSFDAAAKQVCLCCANIEVACLGLLGLGTLIAWLTLFWQLA